MSCECWRFECREEEEGEEEEEEEEEEVEEDTREYKQSNQSRGKKPFDVNQNNPTWCHHQRQPH